MIGSRIINVITYYSFRHFGITARLYADVSFTDLPRLAGTSLVLLKTITSN